MNILITGATGMAGAEVVRQSLRDPAIQRIVLLTRRPSGFSDQKIKEIIHADFTAFDDLDEEFRQTDACIWCLGISQSRVSRNEYFRITHDFVVAAAKRMLAVNPSMAFIFLSAEGADGSGKIPIRFSKIKGQAENALIALRPEKLFIFRPGGIVASNRNERESLYKRFEILMVKIMSAVFPWAVISTRDLALAMLKVAREGYEKTIIGHRHIKLLK